MKRPLSLLPVLALFLAIPLVKAAEQAPVTLTIKNFRTLTNAVATLAEAGSPGSTGQALAGLQGMLGEAALKALDAERPWQVAVWLEGLGERPAVSLWVPTRDFSAFKSALSSSSLLLSAGTEAEITAKGDFAAVYLAGAAPSQTASAAHGAWTADQIAASDAVLSLAIRPTEALRQQLIQGLAMMRMVVGGAIGAQGQAVPGMDPMAMAELLGVYFDVIDVGLKGWETFHLGLEVEQNALRIRERIAAVAGSELATWLKGGQGSFASVLPYADDTSPAAFAFRCNEVPAYMPTLKKFLRMSLKMQGVPADSEAVKDTERLLDLIAPMQFAGSLDLQNGVEFSGVYEFPGRDVKEIYGLMRNYMETSMQGQVGEGKPYKEAAFKAAQREVSGRQVDRLTLAFNLDAPLYQMPGQKEMIEGLFPGGRMEFDYVVKDGSLVIASPSRLEGALKVGSGSPKASLAVQRPTTVLAARVNVLRLIPQVMKANPMIPEETKRQFEGMDTQGTDIQLTVDLDGAFSTEIVVPLQLIRSAAKTM